MHNCIETCIYSHVSEKLLALYEKYPILTITNLRQSGKTTLIKQLFGEKLPYISLEDLDLRSFATEDTRGFLLLNTQYLYDSAIPLTCCTFAYYGSLCFNRIYSLSPKSTKK